MKDKGRRPDIPDVDATLFIIVNAITGEETASFITKKDFGISSP